jgi:hypothetical protein
MGEPIKSPFWEILQREIAARKEIAALKKLGKAPTKIS